MQNPIVNGALKSLWHTMPSNICKGIPNVSQQAYAKPCKPVDIGLRKISDGRITPLLLPGGGLEKLQGRFKEEQYFNNNDHILLAQIQQSGHRFKCEKNASNWGEYERMASACSTIVSLRQTGMLNKNRNGPEESFFLQEQKGLLERILEVIKAIIYRSGNQPYPPPYGPYGPQSPYGPPGPYGPYYRQNVTNRQEEKTNEDANDAEANENDSVAEAEADNGKTSAESDADPDIDVEEKVQTDIEERYEQQDDRDDRSGRDEISNISNWNGGKVRT